MWEGALLSCEREKPSIENVVAHETLAKDFILFY